MLRSHFRLASWNCRTLITGHAGHKYECYLNSGAVDIRQMTTNRFSVDSWGNATARKYYSSKNNFDVDEEIYVGPLSKKLFLLKVTTLTTSIATLIIVKDLHSRMEFPNQTVMIVSMGILLFFNFLTPVLINLISKKYCVRMCYCHSKKEYVAEIYTCMFKKKKIAFTPEDVVVPDINRLLTVAYVKGYPLFFDVNHFKTIDYYKNIMSYDKPVDLKLSENRTEKSTSADR